MMLGGADSGKIQFRDVRRTSNGKGGLLSLVAQKRTAILYPA